MAKITAYIPEPTPEYDVNNQRQILESISTLKNQLNFFLKFGLNYVLKGSGNEFERIEEIKNGKDDVQFIEIMACPGGCIGGGGQPYGTTNKVRFNKLETMMYPGLLTRRRNKKRIYARCKNKDPSSLPSLPSNSHNSIHKTTKV